jgi:hypothetical protein
MLLESCPGLIEGPIYATVAALDLASQRISEFNKNSSSLSFEPSSAVADSGHASARMAARNVQGPLRPPSLALDPMVSLVDALLAQIPKAAAAARQVSNEQPQQAQRAEQQRKVLRCCWLPAPSHVQATNLFLGVKVS